MWWSGGDLKFVAEQGLAHLNAFTDYIKMREANVVR